MQASVFRGELLSIKGKIEELKKKRNAIILAHYYQPAQIQAAADIVGDSLELIGAASQTDAEVVVLCGAGFMAEAARILSPDKKILLPGGDVPCSAGGEITVESVLEQKRRLGGIPVVSCICAGAGIVGISDACCTPANALNTLKSLKDKELLFVGDRNLGDYLQSRFPEKAIRLYGGYCSVYKHFSFDELVRLKGEHPSAVIVVHPMAPPVVRNMADFVGSIKAIVNYCVESSCGEFIVGAENDILFELKRRAPSKEFYIMGGRAVCEGMKSVSLEDVERALYRGVYSVELDGEVAKRARSAVSRMMRVERD